MSGLSCFMNVNVMGRCKNIRYRIWNVPMKKIIHTFGNFNLIDIM